MIKNAETFNAYFVIFATTTEVSVYRFQAENALRNNNLKFDKDGRISGYSIIMNAKYNFLRENIRESMIRGTDDTKTPIIRLEDDKKWLNALVRFTEQVYKY